ncbi:MAG: D-aminoacylase, partial [Actinomycetes bacterium]
MYDLVLRNADLVDGTGAKRRPADVGISNGVIVEVADAGTLGRATREVDADGRLLTPGFVDVHT